MLHCCARYSSKSVSGIKTTQLGNYYFDSGPVEEQKQRAAEPERAHCEGWSVSFCRVLAASVVVTGPQIFRVSLEVHRETPVVQLFTGQDQVLPLVLNAPDATRTGLAPHRHKREGLLADAQVLLVRLASCVGAHGHDPLQVVLGEEGLCGSVTATVVPNVFLPLVLVQRPRRVIADVALSERVETVVPLGKLARSLVSGTSLLPEQETHNQRQINLERSHCTAVLKPGQKCYV